MLHSQPQDHDYLTDSLDEVEALIDGLAFNVQDRNWLVYCAMGGHEHYALPEVGRLTGMSMPELYSEAA